MDPGPPGAWAKSASCKGTPVELLDFFGKTRLDWGMSKGICKGCPVRQQCLSYALEARCTTGVWGGLDPLELRFALGRDADGDLWTYTRTDVKCPACRAQTTSTPISDDLALRECENCGFEWTRAERQKPKRRRRRVAVVAVAVVAVPPQGQAADVETNVHVA